MSHTKELTEMVEAIAGTKVLVVGDPILDVYHHGEVTRISQEAPVPVFVEAHVETREGGACNVLKNLRALGAQADAVLPVSAWTAKHRYLVGHHQVFRLDDDIDHQELYCDEHVRELMDWCDAAILSDYGKGTLGENFCQDFIGHMTAGKPIVVDPRGGDWNKYAGATVICPNEHEWAQHCAIKHGTQAVFPYQLLKLGAKGMQLGAHPVASDKHILWRSHTRARQVFDVTGAGDTVIAVFTAAGAQQRDPRLAAELANMAAGVVVGKVGTATCSKEELLKEIERG